MKRSNHRVLTTSTGSLPRPTDLAEMLVAEAKGEPVDAAAMQERVRAATAEVVRRQVELGIDVVSDGEMSKNNFIDYVVERLEGFTPTDMADDDAYWASYFHDLEEFPEIVEATYGGTVFRILDCTGDVKYVGDEQVQRDIETFKSALEQSPATEAFMPAASPGVVAQSLPNRHYKTYEEYVFAVAEALNREYKAITDAGLLVQLDSPDIGTAGDLVTWSTPLIGDRGPRWMQDLHVEAINVGLAGIPADRARMHVCWANYQGPHTHDLPLGEALEPALRANVGAISFEAANPAHAHEWEFFQDFKLPDDKVIIPGVIDTKSQVVENPRLVAQRIARYADLVGSEQLIAGTDCGFGTAVGALQVHPKVAWLKLGALAQGAALAAGG